MKSKMIVGRPDPHSQEGRIAITEMVMKLFDLWELPAKDQLVFLGLSPGSYWTLARYRKGYPFANHRDLMDRAGNLLAIHRSLRILWPPCRPGVLDSLPAGVAHISMSTIRVQLSRRLAEAHREPWQA